MSARVLEKLPNSTVTITGNQVTRIEYWVLWNGEPWPTIVVERRSDGFCSLVGTPEGGGTKSGTLEEVLACLDKALAQDYRRAFQFVDPTARDLNEAGFNDNWKVVRK